MKYTLVGHFGFGVVVGAKADDLLELGFGVFDVNLVISREVVWSLIGELRVVLFVLSFLIVLVADGHMAWKELFVSFHKANKVGWITWNYLRAIVVFIDLLIKIWILVIAVNFDEIFFWVDLDQFHGLLNWKLLKIKKSPTYFAATFVISFQNELMGANIIFKCKSKYFWDNIIHSNIIIDNFYAYYKWIYFIKNSRIILWFYCKTYFPNGFEPTFGFNFFCLTGPYNALILFIFIFKLWRWISSLKIVLIFDLFWILYTLRLIELKGSFILNIEN